MSLVSAVVPPKLVCDPTKCMEDAVFKGLAQDNASDALALGSTKHSHNQEELIAGTW